MLNFRLIKLICYYNRYSDLFESSDGVGAAKLGAPNNSRSMMSLSRIHESVTTPSGRNKSSKPNPNKKLNRYSEMITSDTNFSLISSSNPPNVYMDSEERIEQQSAIDSALANEIQTTKSRPASNADNKRKQMTTTITKHCISNPCAFQHINSLKDNDQHVKLLIDTFNLAHETNGNNNTVQITNKNKPKPFTNSKSFFNKKH